MKTGNTLGHVIAIILVSVIHVSLLFAQQNSFQVIQQRVDSLLDSDKRSIWVEQIDTTGRMFAAGAFTKLLVRFAPTAQVLLDFENYNSIFSHVSVVEGIGSRHGTFDIAKDYYGEGHALFIKAWGMARIDTLQFFPDSCLFLRIRPTKNIILLNYFRNKHRGIFRYYLKNIHVDAYLIKTDSKHCRIGIFAWAYTRSKVPSWLITFAMRIMIPRFITDLERYVKKNINKIPRLHEE